MRYTVSTGYRPRTIRINITAKKQCVVMLNAQDAYLPNTFFTRRNRVFQAGEKQSLYIQIPRPGRYVIVSIFEDGMAEDTMPANFTIDSVRLFALPKQMNVIDWNNKYIKRFIPFVNRFCFNAGWLPAKMYQSKNGVFRFNYVPTIIGNGGDQALTPARIGVYDHIIDLAQDKIVPMTVPGRKFITYHELSHIYLNEKMTNEYEADLNGAIIYLAEGNPIIDAKETVLNVFGQSDTDINRDRYNTLVEFIDGWEELNQKFL